MSVLDTLPPPPPFVTVVTNVNVCSYESSNFKTACIPCLSTSAARRLGLNSAASGSSSGRLSWLLSVCNSRGTNAVRHGQYVSFVFSVLLLSPLHPVLGTALLQFQYSISLDFLNHFDDHHVVYLWNPFFFFVLEIMALS